MVEDVSTQNDAVTTPKQLDIFVDSDLVRASNALCSALERGDVARARRAYRKLKKIDPAHFWLSPAQILIAALKTPLPVSVEDGCKMLTLLKSEWLYAADTIFGVGRHSILDSRWRGVAESLESKGFDSSHPELHPSYAYEQVSDWRSVEDCIRRVPGFEKQATLLARIAEALGRQGRRIESIGFWVALCWRSPGEVARLMATDRVNDKALRECWFHGLDQDFDPAPTGAWFPAWMLLQEPGLALKIEPPAGTSPPEVAFAIIRCLMLGDGEDTGLRRRLQELSPGLLTHFLARLASKQG